jgi:hypothetical protein
MIYLLVGVPGSGKTWVCNQLKHLYTHIAHDDYQKGGYIEAILEAIPSSKPLLIETPFSMSKVFGPLIDKGLAVECVFMLERHSVLKARYMAREGKEIPKGHLTRQDTYKQRAEASEAFYGSSEEVLEYLKGKGNK